MKHDLLELSQRDTRWADIKLGTSQTVTIGQAGCYDTSFCSVADYFGHSINPDELNQKFKDAKLFSSDDLVSNDNDLEQIFPDIKYTTSLYYPNNPPTPADLSKLRDIVNDPRNAVILMIDLHNRSVHLSPVVDCDGATVTIMNTWTGHTENFTLNYGDPKTNILKYVIYNGTPKTDDPLVCDKKSIRDMLVTKATNLDKIGTYLKYPPDIFSHSDFGDAVVDKIGQIQTAYNTMNYAWTHQVSSTTTAATTSTGPTVGTTTQAVPDVTTLPQTTKDSFLVALFKSVLLLGKEGAK